MSSSERLKEAQTWCSDALHDLVGFADSALASYLVSVASRSGSTPQAIVQVLKEGDVQAPADKMQQFAQALHAKCSRSAVAKPQRVTNADWTKQAAKYTLLEHKDEEHSAQPVTKAKSRDKKERVRDKKKSRRRDREESEDESEEEVPVQKSSTQDRRERRRAEKRKESALTEQEKADIEREKDLKEKEEFVQRMLERDKSKTKSKVKSEPGDDASHKKRADAEERLARGETVIDESTGTALTLEKLREQSRHQYLKKREERELTLLQQSLQDEEELFKDQKLTEAEKKRITLGKQILDMVQSRGDDAEEDRNDGFYRLPDEYNEKGTKEDQDRALLSSRYVEPKTEKSEQDLWEESQTTGFCTPNEEEPSWRKNFQRVS